MASRPKIKGRTIIKMDGQIKLRDNEIIKALFVLAVDCQNEIIKMLKPARKNPQK